MTLDTRPLDISTCDADELIAEIERQKIEEARLHALAVMEQNQLLDDIQKRLENIEARQNEQAVVLTQIRNLLTGKELEDD
jgi:hypothetical protein